MISVEMQFGEHRLRSALAALDRLAEELAPVRFSQDERAALADDLVSNTQRFDAFIESTTYGFFLHGRKSVFMVLPRAGRVGIFAHRLNTKAAEEVFRALVGASPFFGYAAVLGERFHRNMLVTKVQPGRTRETWVGRDTSRYIPGLYWLTWLSKEYLCTRRVDPSVIASAAIEVEEHLDGWMFRFFQSATKWQEEASRLDAFCFATEGIFSIMRAREALMASRETGEASSALSEWE